MSSKTAAAIITAALAAAVIAAAVMRLFPKGTIAQVVADNQVVREINLETVKESYTFTVEFGGEKNTVLVENDAISVISASCPDKICVKRGKLSKESPEPIVCIPNRLIISLEEQQ